MDDGNEETSKTTTARFHFPVSKAYAAALQGNLLIVHGSGDENIPYRGTERLINEFIARNKPFTVMSYPNRDHLINLGNRTSRHLYELMTDCLHRHLPVP